MKIIEFSGLADLLFNVQQRIKISLGHLGCNSLLIIQNAFPRNEDALGCVFFHPGSKAKPSNPIFRSVGTILWLCFRKCIGDKSATSATLHQDDIRFLVGECKKNQAESSWTPLLLEGAEHHKPCHQFRRRWVFWKLIFGQSQCNPFCDRNTNSATKMLK